MSFSSIHEIVIDSSYRLNAATTSSTDYEYAFPFVFPTRGPAHLKLLGCKIPNSFYNMPATTVETASVGTFPQALSLGRYDAAQIVTDLNAAFAAYITASAVGGTLTVSYDGKTKKFTFVRVGAALNLACGWFPLMGNTSANPNVVNFNGSITFSNVASLGAEDEQQFYIRISSFENKIILPQIYPSFISYAIDLNYYDAKTDYFFMDLRDDKAAQALGVASSYFNTNQILRIQLLNRRGEIVDLNGRNWMFTIRVERAGQGVA